MTDSTAFAVGPHAEPDKYRLLRQVGGGGEAEIWQAAVSLAGGSEQVAVKILRDIHSVDAQAWQDRWSSQVELLRLLRHPGVVGVHEYFAGPRMHHLGEADEVTRHHYLVMNWVDGVDLRQWSGRDRESFDRYEALRHLTQIADVLDWLHSGTATTSHREVVHGDISPGNVIINTDGQAVLVDFGLFRMAQDGDAPAIGTQGYCAPEVLTRGEYTAAADLYGFGALACFVLTGENPPSDSAQLREVIRNWLAPMFGAADLEALTSIAADDPQARPKAGEWMRILRPHASTVAPREAPLPPRRPGNDYIPPGRSAPVTAVPAMSHEAPPAGETTHTAAASVKVAPQPKQPVWLWVTLGVGGSLVMVLLAAALLFIIVRPDGIDTSYEDSPNQTELFELQPSVVEGFSKSTGSDSRWGNFVSDCGDDPRIEYTLNGAYTWADIWFTYTASAGDAGQPVKFTMYADGDVVSEVESPQYDIVTLNGDISGARTLVLEITGAKAGQCTAEGGTLSFQ